MCCIVSLASAFTPPSWCLTEWKSSPAEPRGRPCAGQATVAAVILCLVCRQKASAPREAPRSSATSSLTVLNLQIRTKSKTAPRNFLRLSSGQSPKTGMLSFFAFDEKRLKQFLVVALRSRHTHLHMRRWKTLLSYFYFNICAIYT